MHKREQLLEAEKAVLDLDKATIRLKEAIVDDIERRSGNSARPSRKYLEETDRAINLLCKSIYELTKAIAAETLTNTVTEQSVASDTVNEYIHRVSDSE